jgi:dCTP deaminase
VLARLIVDGMADYEKFEPTEAAEGSGLLYVEITPITFDVCVKADVALTQLRFFLGDPRDVEIKTKEMYRTALKKSSKDDGTLSVDLQPVEVGGLPVSAFSTIVEESKDPISLWEEDAAESRKPDPWRYWRFRQTDERGRLRIKKDQFYILRSREEIALPPGVAVYCRASDETIGEMRIHYAGFVHPYFGRNRDDNHTGTPLIFEVRGHDVDVNLLQGERMARLIFYRMSSDATSDKKTNYGKQTLKLSKFFGEWPSELTWSDEEKGIVVPKEG